VSAALVIIEQEPETRELRFVRDGRDVGLVIANSRSPAVRERLALQTAALDPAAEEEALRWIESVSEFDNPESAN
jgi:hypothetical protein